MTDLKTRCGVIGGGISGLSLAYFLGGDAEVLEKEDACGGLCRTFEKDGFLFDQGGHALFSHDKSVLALELELLGTNILKHRRNVGIWYKGRPVKYPFENGLASLDKEDIFECLRDYLSAPSGKPTNLEEWFIATFGRAMSEKYMLPYNRKIWKLDPSLMGLQFVERIPRPPLEDVLRSAIGIETEGYTFQLHYYYPERGGFEALPKAFEAKLSNVRKGVNIRRVTREADGWTLEFADGSRRTYATLVSTIPIFELLPLLAEPVPEEVRHAVRSLRYNALRVVLVGVKKLLRLGFGAMYTADAASPAHRYCFSEAFSPHMAPNGGTSIFAEVTHPAHEAAPQDDAELERQTIEWLVNEGFIARADIVTTDVRSIHYAYPVYDLGYGSNVEVIRRYFDRIGLHLLGRFAEFAYINSDVCITRARALSQRLLA